LPQSPSSPPPASRRNRLGSGDVTDPWVRGTVTGQKATGAFMQLKSPADAALVEAASPVAKIVEIHEMKMEGGMMKMRAVEKLPLPAGKAVELKPGGYHVMLMDLVQPLNEGDTVPLKLTFEDKAGRKQTRGEGGGGLSLPAAAGSQTVTGGIGRVGPRDRVRAVRAIGGPPPDFCKAAPHSR
jgi:copper(I)-binding protein